MLRTAYLACARATCGRALMMRNTLPAAPAWPGWQRGAAQASAMQDKADDMIKHLASLSRDRLIISFAPKTLAYSLLKRIGELFPGPSKATRAYLHKEDDVEKALHEAGFEVVKREMTATQFYFSRLLEARRRRK